MEQYKGLTSREVKSRIDAGLVNRSTARNSHSKGRIILLHSFTFFNLVFLILAAVLAVSGSSPANMTFLGVVFINTVIGCFQEIRAKSAVEKLTLVAPHDATALRDGQWVKVRWDNLVQDDLVSFAAGDQVCADGVLVSGEIQVNESLITGEADPVQKKPGDSLLSGSFLIAGQGNARLTQVGDNAFATKLANEAKKNPAAAKSEMMRSLDKLIRVVGYSLIPIGLVLFYRQFFNLHLGLRQSAEGTVAALVGMIPEGLYLLTSVALAASALVLSKKRVLVQDMNCIETLARVDVLCVDKTGTITEPTMTVEDILPLNNASLEQISAVLSALYGRTPENDTARALQKRFPQPAAWNCTAFFPFTSQTKWCGGDFENEGSFVAGAPEFVMGHRYNELKEAVDNWSSRGYRVLLAASYAQPLSETLQPEKLQPLALILLNCRLRENAKETFSYFAEQGVAIKVISGDNPATVSRISQQAGIENAEAYIDATELETFEDILAAAEKYTVFGRVTPEQKKQLVIALQKKGHTVAMTGDGVNDVLALKQADCGIAMASGAQAANQVARLVLMDSDFGAMPHIVGEGRRVINNIQRAAALFLVKNIFSFVLALVTLFTGWAYPVLPIHLSVISALTIGIPSFFLAMEPNYERVKGRFLQGVLYRAFPGGLTNIFVVLTAQGFMPMFDFDTGHLQTVCASILAVVGLLVLFQVSRPLSKFRMLIWVLMAGALVCCFTLLRSIFPVQTGNRYTTLVFLTLLMVIPTVFYVVRRLFHLGDKVYQRVVQKRSKANADL